MDQGQRLLTVQLFLSLIFFSYCICLLGNSTTDLPMLVASPTNRGRPGSISLTAGAAALQAEQSASSVADHSHPSAHPHISEHHTLAHSATHPPHLAHTVSIQNTHSHTGTYAVPPLSHHSTSSTHPLLEAAEKFSSHTLNVFFSAPLAGFDRNSRPHPLEMLDYTSERELLTQVCCICEVFLCCILLFL